MKMALISVTKSGDCIAEKLKKKFECDLYSTSNIEKFNLRNISQKAMEEYRAVIFISSTGIAVRAVADFIRSKDVDPAVIVIDSSGRFVISLLSGHIGGANMLSEKIAEYIGAEPVITTATDNIGIKAPDVIASENGLVIDDLKILKNISSLLVDGRKVFFKDEKNVIKCPEGYSGDIEFFEGAVIVTDKKSVPYFEEKCEGTLARLIRKDIVLGIGCMREFESDTMKANVILELSKRNIDIKSVYSIATVDVKASEKAILDLKEYFGCELEIFSKDEISKVQHKFCRSDFVEKVLGITGVCEPCAYLAGASKLTPKLKISGMTLCIGEI